MSNDDKTVELITNLDRRGIETILTQVAAEARSRGLEDIIMLLGNYAAMSPDELRKRIPLCLEALSDSPEHREIFSQLEIAELNLPNLR